MFCTNCGNKIEEGADVCVHCGKLLKQTQTQPVARKKYSGLSIAAMVLGIIGVFFSISCLSEMDMAIEEMIAFDVSAGRFGFIIGYLLIPMIFGILSLIFSIIEFKKSKNGMNIAGLSLSILIFVLEGLQGIILVGNL